MTITPRGLARQISLFSALVLAAAGCGGGHHDTGPVNGTSSGGVTPHTAPTPAPSTPLSAVPSAVGTYDLTLFWSFERHVRGQQPVLYDGNPLPGGTDSGPCSQSGVDTVAVYNADGTPLYPSGSDVDCVYGGIQGATYPGFSPGTYDLIVTGYRNGVALYENAIRVDVTTSGADAYDVSVPGIPDDLDIYAAFVDSTGAVYWTTCRAAGVSTLEFNLIDGAKTTVDAGSIACEDPPPTDQSRPPRLSYRSAVGDGLDRDDYTIWMRGLDPSGAVLFDSTPPNCADPGFQHLGSDTSPAEGWLVGLYVLPETVCQP